MENMGGLNEETVEENSTEQKVMNLEEKKNLRKPFHYWTVGGKEYRMKLKASAIGKLENKYRKNIMSLIMEDDTPPLSVMLTIIQAAMDQWEHKTRYTDVQNLYDKWTEEEGGNQQDLLTKVIIPLMVVSGFFTEEQSNQLLEELN